MVVPFDKPFIGLALPLHPGTGLSNSNRPGFNVSPHRYDTVKKAILVLSRESSPVKSGEPFPPGPSRESLPRLVVPRANVGEAAQTNRAGSANPGRRCPDRRLPSI